MHKNLFDFTLGELEELFLSLGEKKFRAKQFFHWIYKKGVFDIKKMSNFSDKLKDNLLSKFDFKLPSVNHYSYCKQDNSYKFLIECGDGALVESVLILSGDRATICLSCMVGCPLKCKFCATGTKLRFKRNLKSSEIIAQVLLVRDFIEKNKISEKITNIVFMGMGEPLLNLNNIEKALTLLVGQHAFAMSKNRITVSTAGVTKGLSDLINKFKVKLAVSLHFPTDDQRNLFMPVNRKFPLSCLFSELKKINLEKRSYITIEYLMINKVNDTLAHAKQLLKLIHGLKVKINLIPYNEVEGFEGRPSSEDQVDLFFNYLKQKSVVVTVRRSKGTDVNGACGQLALNNERKLNVI